MALDPVGEGHRALPPPSLSTGAVPYPPRAGTVPRPYESNRSRRVGAPTKAYPPILTSFILHPSSATFEISNAAYFTPQSKMTFPEWPLPMTSKPFWNSSMGKRCVMTGLISKPAWIMEAILYHVSNISRP